MIDRTERKRLYEQLQEIGDPHEATSEVDRLTVEIRDMVREGRYRGSLESLRAECLRIVDLCDRQSPRTRTATAAQALVTVADWLKADDQHDALTGLRKIRRTDTAVSLGTMIDKHRKSN